MHMSLGLDLMALKKLVTPGFEMGDICDWSSITSLMEIINDSSSSFVTETQISDVDVTEISVTQMKLALSTRYILLSVL